MSSKIGSISEESKILHEIKPRIDSLIFEISQEISKTKNDKIFEEFFNQEIVINEESNSIFAYYILEILWLYEIVRKENTKLKLSKGLKKE